MSSKEFAEWMAYYKFDPFGFERHDLAAAVVACTVANSQRDPKSTPTPYQPEQFLPKFYEPEEEKEEARNLDMTAKMLSAHHAFGGTGNIQ